MNLVGLAGGALLAPLTGLVSFLRQSRTFHPRGLVCRANVEPVADAGELVELARALSGTVLVRFSGALWKCAERPDVLGCALRFSRDPLSVTPRPDDQDLLFATIRRPWTMALSPFTTNFRDYLSNRYYAVSPFRVTRPGRIEWRLTPERSAPIGASRADRFERALAEGSAALALEWSPYRPPWRAFDEAAFRPLVRLTGFELADLDQESLRFDPFRAGRGIAPVGFVHALRRATYSASQKTRPARERLPRTA